MNWIRKNIFWLAIVAVIGTVAWMGTSAVSSMHSMRDNNAGALFGSPVSLANIISSMDSARRQAIVRYGDKYKEKVSDEILQQQAWERLMLLAEARRLKISASDEEVRAQMLSEPLFQDKSGKFDNSSYQAMVQYGLGTTPRRFEEDMREELIIRKLINKAIGTAAPTDAEITEAFERENRAIRLEYAKLSDEKTAAAILEGCKTNADLFPALVKENKASLETTGFFKLTDKLPDLGPTTAFYAAFDKKEGELCGPFPTAKNEWIVARVKAIQPADPKKLDEKSRKELAAQVEQQKKFKSYITWYQELMKRANPQKTVQGNPPQLKKPAAPNPNTPISLNS